MKKAVAVLILFCLLVVSCAPVQTPAPTPVPTQTPVPSSTDTAIPTITATRTLPPRPSRTPSPSRTPTPPPDTPAYPNLGLKAEDAVDGMSLISTITFVDIPDIDGQSAQRADIPKDFTTITLIGKPYLTRAELQIDVSKLKDIDIINIYIITFLISTVPDGGFEAQDWARHSLSEAADKGSTEKTFGESKIVIKIKNGKMLDMTVLPAENG